jgi:hypothetical protein
MHMLYNSDSFVVVQFDVPAEAASAQPLDGGGDVGGEATSAKRPHSVARGGYEIVDKFLRKEIFIDGAMAQSFKEGVEALIETQPSEEEMDTYIERYAGLMQQPVVLH